MQEGRGPEILSNRIETYDVDALDFEVLKHKTLRKDRERVKRILEYYGVKCGADTPDVLVRNYGRTARVKTSF